VKVKEKDPQGVSTDSSNVYFFDVFWAKEMS